MRVSITAEKSLINELTTAIDQAPDNRVEKVEEAKDQTELAFGIGEILTIISVIKGISSLVEIIMKLKNKFGAKTQKLHLKTALGTAVIEISQDITPEQLRQQLATIMS